MSTRQLVRASQLAATAPPSLTFASFFHFVGDEPFTISEEYFARMLELDKSGVTWISGLREKEKSMWALDRVIPDATVLTMGPLEGSLEWRLSKLKPKRIVAVEGHHDNYLKCEVLKTIFLEMPVDFIEGDVLTTDFKGEFDVIFCPGVLYHLSKPW